MTKDQATEMSAVDRQQAALAAEQERLLGLCRAVSGDVLEEIDSASQELSDVDQHPADSGTELHDHGRDLSLLEQLNQQLRNVEESLERLERGEYGMCSVCGEPIGAARLEALPATRMCLLHQERAEREVGRAGVSGGDTGPVSPI